MLVHITFTIPFTPLTAAFIHAKNGIKTNKFFASVFSENINSLSAIIFIANVKNALLAFVWDAVASLVSSAHLNQAIWYKNLQQPDQKQEKRCRAYYASDLIRSANIREQISFAGTLFFKMCFQKLILFPQQMHNVFDGSVAMTFFWQQ